MYDYVHREWLRWTKYGWSGRPFNFLDFSNGSGKVVSGEMPDAQDQRIEETLDSREMLAVNTLGSSPNTRVSVRHAPVHPGWYLSYLSADDARGVPEAGPQERLSPRGTTWPTSCSTSRISITPDWSESCMCLCLADPVPGARGGGPDGRRTAACSRSRTRRSTSRCWPSSPPTARSRCWPI